MTITILGDKREFIDLTLENVISSNVMFAYDDHLRVTVLRDNGEETSIIVPIDVQINTIP